MKTYILTFIYLLTAADLFAQSGVVDATFGGSGQVVTTINNSGMANGIAIQTDDKIIAVGSAALNAGNAFAMVRYTTNGYLDGTFGGVGIVSTYIGTSAAANCVLLQPNGQIVLAGKSMNTNGNYDFTLARYNTGGGLDSTFGVNGIAITNLGGDDEATAVSIQTDGKLVAAGFSNINDSTSGIAVVRYNTNGNLDSTFGKAGIVLTPVSLSAEVPAPMQKPDCKIQANGQIVVVTTVFNGSNDFIVLRYNTNGTADNSFGTNGQVATDFGANNDYGYAVFIQPDGKIVAAGSSVNPTTDSGYMALARYNADGSMDNTFGDSGKVMALATSGGGIDARSLAMQTDGNIITGGSEASATLTDEQQFIIAKYSPNGSLNDSFGNGGRTNTEIAYTGIMGNSIALQSTGEIVMGGGNGQSFILTRFLNDADSVTAIDTGHVDTISTAIAASPPAVTGITAYPNPTHDNVVLQYTLTGNDNVTIRLSDVLGQQLATVLNDAAQLPGLQNEHINLASLPSGYYMVTLYTSKGESTVRLVKE